MNQMSLNYATIASALSAQTEQQYRPRQQPTQVYQKPRPSNNNYSSNILCYRCNERGHIARDCMSERLPTKEQRYQLNQRTQVKKNIHYAATEQDEDYDDYSENEVYIR